ncbi:hypothetical protein MNBD_GAMMA26-903 [hydrothermal vent metagenome]|uniref:Uncharacterized protein n=1 Tax=hydrothermal vent metagenome TaxID=652676 RepID=A0A3B1AJH5_9ZZZZ
MNEHNQKFMPELAKQVEDYQRIKAPAGFAIRVSHAATTHRPVPISSRWFLAPALAASIVLLAIILWSQNNKLPDKMIEPYYQLPHLSEVSDWLSEEQYNMTIPTMSELTALPLMPSWHDLEEEEIPPTQPQSLHFLPTDSPAIAYLHHTGASI